MMGRMTMARVEAAAAGRASRRRWAVAARFGAAVALAACSGGAAGGRPAPADAPAGTPAAARPNIVWIVADAIDGTHAVQSLGGGRTVVAESAAVASDPAAARAALLTGMRPQALGLDAETGRLAVPPPVGVRVLPERLRRAGYYTSRAGAPRHGLARARAEPVAVVHVDGGVHEAARALPVAVGDLAQPGLLGAWDAAGPDADWRGREKDWESPCTVAFGCGGARTPGPRPFFALFNVDTGGAGREQALGDRVARIVGDLAADDLLEGTVVFVIGAGGTAPTVAVRWPSRIAGANEPEAAVGLLDLAPTALALAGAAVPAYMEGRALARADGNAPLAGPGEAAAEERAPSGPSAAAAPAPGPPAAAAARQEGAGGSSRVVASGVPVAPPVAATPDGYPTGGLFHVAPRVDLRCGTAGSTIVYTTEHEAPFYWRLYTGPFRMRFWTLRFQCGRLGYRDSDIVAFDFDIE